MSQPATAVADVKEQPATAVAAAAAIDEQQSSDVDAVNSDNEPSPESLTAVQFLMRMDENVVAMESRLVDQTLRELHERHRLNDRWGGPP